MNQAQLDVVVQDLIDRLEMRVAMKKDIRKGLCDGRAHPIVRFVPTEWSSHTNAGLTGQGRRWPHLCFELKVFEWQPVFQIVLMEANDLAPNWAARLEQLSDQTPSA